ncbi:MAG: glycine zipper 2TM domain-containing protein [Aromatoleum sp.]|nr:glycine zipper 2TM domain-containing protein [Aromatoleum sp.]
MNAPIFRSGAVLLALAALFLVAGCAPERSGDVYQRGEALRAQSVEFGTIESLRPVRIDGGQSGVGTVGGAVLGGIAGSTIGGGRGSTAGAVAGAILGGIVGSAVEKDVTKANGVEVTVRLDSGRMVAIVQEGSGDEFRPGDRVRVTSDGYTTRVTR